VTGTDPTFLAVIPPDENPLTARNYTEINGALAQLNRATRKIERACSAGINCDQYQADINYLQDRLDKLKRVYFPNKA
jgi:hypothetical protein